MNSTARNISKEPPMSDTRHLSELKFDERPATAQALETPAPLTTSETLATDMVMLQKADVWMSQFKTRLNFGIIAMVVLWGGVSYYKGAEMHMEAKATPEVTRLVADGSVEADRLPPQVEGDTLDRFETDVEPATAVETASEAPIKVVKPKVAKKSIAKLHKTKGSGGKVQSRNQKKLKKTLAAKPAA